MSVEVANTHSIYSHTNGECSHEQVYFYVTSTNRVLFYPVMPVFLIRYYKHAIFLSLQKKEATHTHALVNSFHALLLLVSKGLKRKRCLV